MQTLLSKLKESGYTVYRGVRRDNTVTSTVYLVTPSRHILSITDVPSGYYHLSFNYPPEKRIGSSYRCLSNVPLGRKGINLESIKEAERVGRELLMMYEHENFKSVEEWKESLRDVYTLKELNE